MCSFPLLLFRHRDMITSIVCRSDVMGGEESFTKQTPPHAGSRLQNARVGREGNLRFLLACQAARNCLNSNANESFFLALMWLQTVTPTEVKIIFLLVKLIEILTNDTNCVQIAQNYVTCITESGVLRKCICFCDIPRLCK